MTTELSSLLDVFWGPHGKGARFWGVDGRPVPSDELLVPIESEIEAFCTSTRDGGHRWALWHRHQSVLDTGSAFRRGAARREAAEAFVRRMRADARAELLRVLSVPGAEHRAALARTLAKPAGWTSAEVLGFLRGDRSDAASEEAAVVFPIDLPLAAAASRSGDHAWKWRVSSKSDSKTLDHGVATSLPEARPAIIASVLDLLPAPHLIRLRRALDSDSCYPAGQVRKITEASSDPRLSLVWKASAYDPDDQYIGVESAAEEENPAQFRHVVFRPVVGRPPVDLAAPGAPPPVAPEVTGRVGLSARLLMTFDVADPRGGTNWVLTRDVGGRHRVVLAEGATSTFRDAAAKGLITLLHVLYPEERRDLATIFDVQSLGRIRHHPIGHRLDHMRPPVHLLATLSDPSASRGAASRPAPEPVPFPVVRDELPV